MKRNIQIDLLKTIGIALVVLGHLVPGPRALRFIYSFHIFLFFSCSGFLGERYNNRRFTEILIANCKRVLVPYCIWQVISLFVDYLTKNINLSQGLLQLTYFNAYVGWNSPLWFLVALFWSDSICALIIKQRKWIQYMATGLFLALWILLAVKKTVIPFGIYTIPATSFFWMLGYAIKSKEVLQKLLEYKSKVLKILLAIVLFIITLCFGVFFNETISVYLIWYSKIVYTILAGIAGVFMCFLLSSIYSGKYDWLNNIIQKYGNNTRLILCTHYFILRFLRFLTMRFMGFDLWGYQSTLKAIALMIFLVALYYPIILCTESLKKKWHPLTYVF